MSEARSTVGTLARPSGRGHFAPAILALPCLLAFTGCSVPQSTSSTRHYPSGQNWASSVATSGVPIEASDVSGKQLAAAAENDGDPLGTTEPKLQIAAAQSADTDLATLAQKTNNPISDAWLLITQNDMTLLEGDAINGVEVLNVTKFQPVLSAPLLGGDWNLVVRPVLQFSSVPVDDDVGRLFGVSPNNIVADPSLSAIAADPFGRTTGLGDTVLLTLVGPNSDDGWIFAGGASQILPTATEDVLGQGKWQAGPDAVRRGANFRFFIAPIIPNLLK